ncbi:MAG: polyphosphate polymerase domain-containing protein [Brevefilum sp.]|nr:polyphosphate polymerase domain-containing protein [Brevefilum sp.]
MVAEDLLSTTSRFERKYRCTYAQYYAIKNALYPYILQDYYTKRAPNHRYLVRSLYYDTAHYQIFVEKCGGNSDRVKYRIRTYSDLMSDRPDIRVEMKVRDANLTRKYGAYTTIEDCQKFINQRHWQNNSDPVLAEFERHVLMMNLEPKTLVEYHREGYQTRDGSGTRITFDHHIKSASSCELFPEKVFWFKHHEQMVVLEVKHTNTLEKWLHQVVKSHGLRLVPNSKFAFGIQTSQPGLIVPSWSDR